MNRRLLLTAALLLLLLCLLAFTAERASAQLFWNQAASFAGSSTSYVAIPHSPELDITGSFSLECWINPANITAPTAQIILGKGSSPRYDLRLSPSGAPAGSFAIRTNGTTRAWSSGSVPQGTWSHIAVTYDAPSTTFRFYINGVLDSSAVISGATPTSTTDSVIIGKGFNSPFAGSLDEVRIWNRALSGSEIQRTFRTSLGATGGVYDGLVLSLTFQDNESSGTLFGLSDLSGNSNDGYNRGVTAVDMSYSPPTYLSFNEAIQLDGDNDYLAGPDNSDVSPTTAITMEAWILPYSYNGSVIVQKGTSGAGTNYRLRFNAGALGAGINGNFSFVANAGTVPLHVWTHVAFTYAGATGAYAFYVNGEQTNSATVAPGNINNGTDSLCIGGAAGFLSFNGLIDEVRISNYVKTEAEIRQFLYASIDQANEPNSGQVNVSYNLDGLAVDNADAGPRLFFNGNARFSNPATVGNTPVSPLNRLRLSAGFPDGFTIKTSNRRIPQSGTSGPMVRDSLYVSQSTTMSDVNFFLAANHTYDGDLNVSLIAPNGDSVGVMSNWYMAGQDDNIITVFDNDADTTYVSGRFVSFAPVIRPEGDLDAAFSGDNALGWWILSITDDYGSDTGRVYAWGIQINNQTTVPGVEELPAGLPSEYALAQNYPNPFNPVTTIEYSIGARGPVTLEVYDLLGQKVATLVNEEKAQGRYRVSFDARDVASGAYFYRLTSRDFVGVRKMLILR